MPWDKQYDESEFIDRTMRTFWARGYEGTSIRDLVDATGVNRGSIYAGFDGKRSLFLAALQHYDREHRDAFLARVASRRPGKAAILAAFEAAAESGAPQGQPDGCLLVNTAIELSPHDEEIAALVMASLEKVEDFFREMIERGKSQAEIASSLPSGATAAALLGLFVGLRVLTRSGAARSVREDICSQAREMIER